MGLRTMQGTMNQFTDGTKALLHPLLIFYRRPHNQMCHLHTPTRTSRHTLKPTTLRPHLRYQRNYQPSLLQARWCRHRARRALRLHWWIRRFLRTPGRLLHSFPRERRLRRRMALLLHTKTLSTTLIPLLGLFCTCMYMVR